MSRTIKLLQTRAELDQAVAEAMSAGCVAIDTEFVWERTYYARLGLVQMATSRESCWLLDTPAIDDLSSLGELLADASVTKILHDAQQDLTILRRATGKTACSIFDTRLASGFVGLSSTLSLQDAVRETTGVELAKTESRTDWLRRPLSDSQLEYAEDDVRYMAEVRNTLLERAEAAGNLERLVQEHQRYDNPSLYDDRSPESMWARVKGGGRLSPQERMVLRELAAWREHAARTRDRPRGHITPDDALVELARRKPNSSDQLRSLRKIDKRDAGRDGNAWLECIERGLAVPESEWPQPTPRRSKVEEDRLTARADLCLAVIKGESFAAKLDPALMGSRADVTGFVAAVDRGDSAEHLLLSGWRKDFIGDRLVDVLNGSIPVKVDADTGFATCVES